MEDREVEQEKILSRLIELVDMPGRPLKAVLRTHTALIERAIMIRALDNSSWNVTKAAHSLKTSRKNLQNKIKSLGLENK